MRNIRTKKIKTETSKCYSGPFEDSLIQIQLERNEKCLLQINKNSLQKALQLLKQIKNDQNMLSNYNKEKAVMKSISLNTEAHYFQKTKQYENALKCLNQAESLMQNFGNNTIQITRTKLNKSMILSHLGKHEQAMELGKAALALLRTDKDMLFKDMKKNQIKQYEIMIISFYNIATQLIHLSESEQAGKIYRQGYILASKILGKQHKLTQLLKSIITTRRRSLVESKLKKQNQFEQYKSNHSKSIKETKTVFQQIKGFNKKEKQIKRIYEGVSIETKKIKPNKFTRRDIQYYLKSLQKVKVIYSKKCQQQTESHQSQQDEKLGTYHRLFTESTTSNRIKDNLQHLKTKDVILNGKTIYRSSVTQNQPFEQSIIHPQKTDKINDLSSIKLQTVPIVKPVQQTNIKEEPKFPADLNLAKIALKFQEKRQQNSGSCQLI